jgi:hypothetical protein
VGPPGGGVGLLGGGVGLLGGGVGLLGGGVGLLGGGVGLFGGGVGLLGGGVGPGGGDGLLNGTGDGVEGIGVEPQPPKAVAQHMKTASRAAQNTRRCDRDDDC